ncbi:MAG TPA: hypothetical protein VK097_12950 [Lentibacillus sp.]|uniref:hypothetical protein n=1 Tax=Lentibacillus sp. TaxID=1925746 RepID=UPI002B4B5E14|nr:hypothetical protein [Lentibacillus sp.]HLR63331.1 hypothetical protein [Lentibacillus sp.]
MNQDQNKKPSEMNPEDLPDVRAFSDEFTLDFLQSTEETRDGYYPFLSGTGKYKVDFPAEGVIGERGYSIKEKGHEEIQIHIKSETGSMINIIYYSHHKSKQITENLNGLKLRTGYDGNFNKLEKDNQTLYYAHYKDDVFRTYAGYVQNEKGTGGIEVVYDIDCRDEKEQICAENKQSDEERVMKWMKSIQFVHEDGK